MTKTLKFTELIPAETHYFELEDGSQIAFKGPAGFDAVDLVGFLRIQDEFAALRKSLETGDPNDEDARRLDDLAKNLTLAILPDLPDSVLSQIHILSYERIFDFWAGCYPDFVESNDSENGTGEKKARVRKRSRKSEKSS